jgi:hypothetical protein
MQHKKEAFDAQGFLDLLADVEHHEATGVVSVRIHVRDGIPWAMSVQFDNADERAA